MQCFDTNEPTTTPGLFAPNADRVVGCATVYLNRSSQYGTTEHEVSLAITKLRFLCGDNSQKTSLHPGYLPKTSPRILWSNQPWISLEKLNKPLTKGVSSLTWIPDTSFFNGEVDFFKGTSFTEFSNNLSPTE